MMLNFSLNSFLADSRKSVPSLRSTQAWKVLFLYVQSKSNGKDFHRTRLSVQIFHLQHLKDKHVPIDKTTITERSTGIGIIVLIQRLTFGKIVCQESCSL